LEWKTDEESALMLSDAELVRTAQRGDAASLGVLLERHRAPLNALALGFLGHGPDAQDAVQDAFLITLRKIGQLKEPEAVGGWLRAVVRKVCLSRLRERRGGAPLVELVDSRDSQEPREPRESSAEAYIDRLALREWVWTALAQLPEVLRVTAMLRYFGSYSSYEEIAVILGVPVGTVKSRLYQVKAKLADALMAAAGLAHDEARLVSESQTRFFTGALEELNRGSYETLASAFSDHLVLGYSGDDTESSLDFLIRRVWGEQLEAGVKLHPTNVLASKDVTVIEGDFENPRDDPFHCPPATAIVCFYRNGRIRGLRQYYAQRPEEGRCERRYAVGKRY
jgi:RNA polymerase sigma factor (sigma-70 family)